jgi:8-oxo-dGTP pyrophosphatase MutT (NUDIX family)
METEKIQVPDRRSVPGKFLSSGIIPVYFDDNLPQLAQYLLLRCYNYWDFPKGGVLKGEEPLQGALRELKEETTLEDVSFDWGYEYQETEPYSRGKIARYYIARVKTLEVSLPINPLLGRPEHHEFRWVSCHDGLTMVVPRVRRVLEWAHRLISE